MDAACYDPGLNLVRQTAAVARRTDLPSLVAQAQGGDVGAFEELYRRHVGRVHALCLRMCGDRAEAEELTQDAFVRAWERLSSFRGDSAFSSWLHRLTVNVVLGRWRRRSRRGQLVALEEAGEPKGVGGSPERLGMDLERAIVGLPAGARMVFVLHDVEGWKHREIAGATGLAVGTCKAQLHRARRLLRRALEAR